MYNVIKLERYRIAPALGKNCVVYTDFLKKILNNKDSHYKSVELAILPANFIAVVSMGNMKIMYQCTVNIRLYNSVYYCFSTGFMLATVTL